MELVLESPLDMHLHLRDAQMLENVAPWSARYFSGALIMPNLVPPITTLDSLLSYKERIQKAAIHNPFIPYMTLFFKDNYTKEFLTEVKDQITAIKLYPSGITTNSDGGVRTMDMQILAPVLEVMSELGIPLCVHGESDGFVMDREREFGKTYEKLAKTFPDLTIIMEHITTAYSVELLEKYDNLFATITLHHLYITLDEVAGGVLRPHLFCKPIAKRPEDRKALLQAATATNPKVMFGSDSAPHPTHAKECCGCAAGVFTSPLALPALAQLFEARGALDNLQTFVSDNARRIYGITPPQKIVRLVKEPMEVAKSYGDVVPMFAGENLGWRVDE